MDFSTSFDIANSVLVNIENNGMKYPSINPRKNDNPSNKDQICEVIDESPTNKSTKSCRKMRENSKDSLTQSRYRRRMLRKNKSDSILESKVQTSRNNVPEGSCKIDNVSDYFKSSMDFEVFTAEKNANKITSVSNLSHEIENKRQRLSDERKDTSNFDNLFAESMGLSEPIRFSVKNSPSNGESIIKIDDTSIFSPGKDNAGNMLEKVIYSEDIEGVIFSSESPKWGNILENHNINNCNGNEIDKELELLLSGRILDELATDLPLQMNIETANHVSQVSTKHKNIDLALLEEEEIIINTEETSFIAHRKLSTENLSVESSLIPSKKHVLSVLKTEEKENSFGSNNLSISITNQIKSEKQGSLDMSKCSGPVLNWSASEESPKMKNEVTENKQVFAPNNVERMKDVANWNLPATIIKEYYSKGIRRMFDWQVECLSNPKVLFDHANLVYSAPTSAGKTLVSEILTLKTVIERRKKVLIILPFISVVREKMCYLQELLTSSGFRVDGFYGGYTPPGGFDNIHVAICTIEKANSIINKLLEQNKLESIGMIVVDEIHLISDPGRGYILELLLAKVNYMCRKHEMKIQVVAMSATLANIVLLQNWLQAELYVTRFRPVDLLEMIKVGTKIYNSAIEVIREVDCDVFAELGKDQDNIAQLCIETIMMECSVIVFCPSKDWCENLCLHLASWIMKACKLKSDPGQKILSQIKENYLSEVKTQLKNCPAGLDSVLNKTVSFACAFHHAGLTSEERDIIESNFKSGALKILVATSTLSSGVNLPARRVIIRSPLFAGKKMNSLTYKQMIGRAGRTGKDTLGESILVCTDANFKSGKELVCAELSPIQSCLSSESSMPLKRALLEVISSGISTTKQDVQNFLECTLLHAQNMHESKSIGAILGNSDSGNHSDADGTTKPEIDPLNDSLQFLIEYEFVRLQMNEQTKEMNYVPTRLGMACLSSSLPPSDGLLLFTELQKSRRCFVLETELHAVYLVTPYSVCYQIKDIDWLLYLDLYEKLSSAMKRVAELVGVKESFLVKAMRGHAKLDYKTLQIHKRFYTAMALQELINEVPLCIVSEKYKCSRGLLQSLQQMSSTFAGIVTSFCTSLNWTMLSLIVSEFKERLFFGVHRDLIDLMRIPDLNGQKARALFNSGITSLVELANADCFMVEKILFNSISFESEKMREDENEYDTNKRNQIRCLYITGRAGLTVKDVAKMLITNARRYLELEIGVENVKWNKGESVDTVTTGTQELKQTNDVLSTSKDSNNLALENQSKPTKNLEVKNDIIQKPDNNSDNKDDQNRLNNDRSLSELNSSQTSQGKSKPAIKLQTNGAVRRSPRNQISIASKNSPQSISPKNRLRNQTVKAKANIDKENKIHTNETKRSQRVSDIFADSVIEINSQLAVALDKPKKAKPQTNTETKPLLPANDSPKNNSIEEIVTSQTPKATTPRALRTNASRSGRLRITQKKALARSKKLQSEIKEDSVNSKKHDTKSCNSVEISDCASTSLLHNPLHLNSSHVASTSETGASAISFDRISTIDMCSSKNLFKNSLVDILSSCQIGLSVSVQSLSHKKRPTIGAHLLVNPAQTNGEESAVDFVFDESYCITGVSICAERNVVYFLNFQNNDRSKISREEKVRSVLDLFGKHGLLLRIFDTKEQLKVLQKGIPELKLIRAEIEDPKILNWLLEPDKEMSLQNMAQQYAPECSALFSLVGGCVSRSSIGLKYTSTIAGEIRSGIEACISLHVLPRQLETLERIGNGNLKRFFHELEMPLQHSLWKMETTGFPVDEISLGDLSKRILDIMKKLERKIYETHGSRFNLASTSAVARVLGLHRKPNGKLSTAKQILEKIDSPMANLILSYRKLGATLNKTIQPLIQCIQNGRIHGTSITFTATGRISMHEPNLQNVAKDFFVDVQDRSEQQLISCRSSFRCTGNTSLISADFCQLEMRILTHLSQDEILMKIMRGETDIFRALAARWNKISVNEVSELLRNGTKQICYGIIYGMGLKSLAENLKCDIDEVTTLVEQFHSAYPGIRSYTNKVIKFAKQNGYVETITGRRRYLPHITSSDETLKGQAERQALNTTIQGSAADIAKKAIIRTERNLEKYSVRMGFVASDVNFVLHLHDELIFEVPDRCLQKVLKILRTSMENSAQLNVPLRVKLKAGKSWGSLKEIP